MKIATAAAALSASLFGAAVLTLGAAGTAHAEQFGIDDANDSPHGSDLHAVHVHHRLQKVVVVTTHDNLRRDPRTGSGASIFIDTDAKDRGPEYVFFAGLTDGTDYQLVETEGFHAGQVGDPVDGAHNLRIDYQDDQARFIVARDALGQPDEVRVAVRVSGTRSDGTSAGLTDWLGQPRQLTPWIVSG